MARLGDYVKQIRGVSYKPEDLHASLDDSSIILLRANNIQDGKLVLDDVVFVDKSKVRAEQLLKQGDVLICTSSGSKELVGKAAFVEADMNVTFGAFCKVVRPVMEHPRYLGHYFNSAVYRKQISALSAGANINNIRGEHIDSLEIQIPSINEQVSRSNSLSKIDELISLRKKQLQKLDDLVKSRFVEMFGDPVSNPKEWETVPLSNEADIKIGPFGSLLHKEDYIVGGHALVNPSHIVSGKIVPDHELTVSDEKYAELAVYHLKVGDVVLGRRGEMGRCAVVEQEGLLCGTGSLIIRSKGDLRADFIQKIISFPSFKETIEEMAVGQTMPNLNVPIVSAFQIIKPPKKTQDQYYDFVDKMMRTKTITQQGLNKLEQMKQALMQKYFG